MVDAKQLERTIKYAVPNLRFRWNKELEPFSDKEIATVYMDFYFSEDAGNNDEKFPEWFPMLKRD